MKDDIQNTSCENQHLISIDLEEELWEEIDKKSTNERKTEEEILIEVLQIFEIYRLIYHLEKIYSLQTNSLSIDKELMMWIYAQLIYKKLTL